MEGVRLTKRADALGVEGRRRRDKPRLRWEDCVKRAMVGVGGEWEGSGRGVGGEWEGSGRGVGGEGSGRGVGGKWEGSGRGVGGEWDGSGRGMEKKSEGWRCGEGGDRGPVSVPASPRTSGIKRRATTY